MSTPKPGRAAKSAPAGSAPSVPCPPASPSQNPPPRNQTFRIIAQDPAVRTPEGILMARVTIPAEVLGPGPWGHRAQVIDFDSSTQTLYLPPEYTAGADGLMNDPFSEADPEALLEEPRFHAQNAFVIVMRTLARFERALGRRVSWGFDGHQIKIAPHAFADANAFYSPRDEALLFGYFPGQTGQTIFACLSHDVVAHETAHALLDGLRHRYTEPSSPDQAGFHEGFSDLAALLSIFSLKESVRRVLDLRFQQSPAAAGSVKAPDDRISVQALDRKVLSESILLGLAEEMGAELSPVRGRPLRASATLEQSPRWYQSDRAFEESHRRGEILVAAVLNTFLDVWLARLKALGDAGSLWLDRDRVVEEGANAAERLLTMCIRALDYCPPVHVTYGDFFSALVTADYELYPDAADYPFRPPLRANFAAYGITPSATGTPVEPGLWLPPGEESPEHALNYGRTHFESMLRDPEEVFRFIWENRKALRLYEGAFTRVESVRPCRRIADDGFALRETVVEYVQILSLTLKEATAMGVVPEEGLPAGTEEVRLCGGGVLLFDEYGRVKFHIHNRIDNAPLQKERLRSLVKFGFLPRQPAAPRPFSEMSRRRSSNPLVSTQEGW